MIEQIGKEFLHVIDGLQYSWVHKPEEIQKKFDLAPDECIRKINEVIIDVNAYDIPEQREMTNPELDAKWEEYFK